jgi:hypothetical protein
MEEKKNRLGGLAGSADKLLETLSIHRRQEIRLERTELELFGACFEDRSEEEMAGKRSPRARGYVVHEEFLMSGELFDKPFWAKWLAVCLLVASHKDLGIREDVRWISQRFLLHHRPKGRPSSREVRELIQRWVASKFLTRHQKGGVSYLKFTRRGDFLPPRAGARARLDGMGWDGMGGDDTPTKDSEGLPEEPEKGVGNSPHSEDGPRPGQTYRQWAREVDGADEQREGEELGERINRLQCEAEERDRAGRGGNGLEAS